MFGSMQLDWNGTILAMAISRMLGWDTGECRPVLERAQFLVRVSMALRCVCAEFSTLIQWWTCLLCIFQCAYFNLMRVFLPPEIKCCFQSSF